MQNLGFGLALLAALSWGTYMVPFKLSKSVNFTFYQLLIGVGILISGVVISFVFGYSFNLNWYGLLSGVIWTLANTTSLTAITNLGLSKAGPIMASLVIIGTFLWGVFVFGEISESILVGLISILIIILGVILVSATSNLESQNFKKGLIAACLAGFLWASQIVPLKFGHVDIKDAFFSICFAIFITGLVLAVFKKVKFEKRIVKMGLISGIIWNVGNLTSLLALVLMGLAKTFPITQSANLVGILWGLFYFHEVKERRYRLQILIGGIILMVGIFLLGSV